jgi:hypothetical protein
VDSPRGTEAWHSTNKGHRDNQLSEYRKRIEELFQFHPDPDLLGSLPDAGPKLAPRLLGEIGDDRERFEGDAQNPNA